METEGAGSSMCLLALHKAKRSRRSHGGGTRFVVLGPGRAGPALTDFWAEPLPLDYWKLKKSFDRTRASSPILYSRYIAPVLRRVLTSATRPLSSCGQYTCLTVVTLLLIPFPIPSEAIQADARRCSSSHCAYLLHSGLLIIIVGHAAARRHSRSQSPEIPGRIIFFVTATGRSPPH